MNCNYAIDKFSQAYVEIVSCFRLLAKDNFLRAYNTQKDFITSNNYRDGNPKFSFDVFHFQHHRVYSSAQPFKVRIDFGPAIPAATNLIGYAFVFTNKLVSVSSDGQKQFDLIYVIFSFFITPLFSFIFNFVLLRKASVYLPGKLKTSQFGIASLTISVISYNLLDQLIV